MNYNISTMSYPKKTVNKIFFYLKNWKNFGTFRNFQEFSGIFRNLTSIKKNRNYKKIVIIKINNDKWFRYNVMFHLKLIKILKLWYK